MELVEDQFMEQSLLMRISSRPTRGLECCRWPTVAPAPTAVSSSSPPPRRTGWTGNTWSLEMSFPVMLSSRRLRSWEPKVENLQKRYQLLAVENRQTNI